MRKKIPHLLILIYRARIDRKAYSLTKSLKNYFSRRLCWTFMTFLFLGLLSSWCYRSLWWRHWVAVLVNVPVDISGSKFRINTDPIHIYLTNLSWFFRLCHSKYNFCKVGCFISMVYSFEVRIDDHQALHFIFSSRKVQVVQDNSRPNIFSHFWIILFKKI